MPKTLEQYCNVIQISYELNVGAESKKSPFNCDIVLPITIGSVAIRDELQETSEDELCKRSK